MSNKKNKEKKKHMKQVSLMKAELKEYEKNKGISPQLKMWFYSDDSERDTNIFVSRLNSLLQSELSATDIKMKIANVGLVGTVEIKFNILEDDKKHEYQLDWFEVENEIFFNGPKPTASKFLEVIKLGMETFDDDEEEPGSETSSKEK